MRLEGKAMLVIWNAVDPLVTREYNRWITEEHMRERIAAPGFLRGRRYVASSPSVRRPFLNMYELSDIGNCTSREYLSMLEKPSAWTKKMMPSLGDFSRGGIRIVFSDGYALGGCLGSIQLEISTSTSEHKLSRIMREFFPIGADGVVGVHVGQVNQDASGGLTAEKKLRGSTSSEAGFTHAVFVESVDEPSLLSSIGSISQRLMTELQADRVVDTGVYRLNLIL